MQSSHLRLCPSLPQNVIDAEPEREFPQPLQRFWKIKINEAGLGLAVSEAFQCALNAGAIFRLGQDRDLMKTRHLQCPLPANLRFRTFVRLTRKGREKNSHPAR